MTKVTLAKALNAGLRKAMEDDPKVLIGSSVHGEEFLSDARNEKACADSNCGRDIGD